MALYEIGTGKNATKVGTATGRNPHNTPKLSFIGSIMLLFLKSLYSPAHSTQLSKSEFGIAGAVLPIQKNEHLLLAML